ncbi:unnamed protein product [Diatraea saccharalis]|uniref:Uncharacterized protein n=1 Tax=Diatraea saccharalis TaxID=40085 RepID=A0A9N9RDD4_9NEOP|nr:unnamed protein product [Diatraea saccharalis]
MIPAISKIDNIKLDEDGYPDIQDLFPVLPVPQGRRSPDVDKSFDFDIERIDVNKFKKKMEKFAMTLINNNTLTDTRRQKIPYIKGSWGRARYTIIKAKVMDLMLQVIYMARHSIQSIERSKFFSTKDTGYRIAFTYTRLRRLWRRMMDIYTHIHKKIMHVTLYNTYYYYFKTEPLMLAHMRVIKLHTDFLNLWWVLIKVDGKYTSQLRGTSTTTKTTTTRAPEVTLAKSLETQITDRPTGPPRLPTPQRTTRTPLTTPTEEGSRVHKYDKK